MRTCFLTSSFPGGFNAAFERVLKSYLPDGTSGGNLVFIVSDFADLEGNPRWAAEVRRQFEEIGIRFSGFKIIDHSVSADQAADAIRQAQIVWLSGGDTCRQMESFRAYHLRERLQEFDGIVIGMSAGSINMADRVVLARDVRENTPEMQIYQGLGLVQINIEPHLNPSDTEHQRDIWEASHHAPVYGLFDGSFILVDGEKTVLFGPYCLYNLQNQETNI